MDLRCGRQWRYADSKAGIAPIIRRPTTARKTGLRWVGASVIWREINIPKRLYFTPKMLPAIVYSDPD